MKNIFFYAVFAAFLACAASCAKSESPNSITIYAYDSFCTDWGAAKKISQKFEQKTGIKANFVSCGDAGQTLAKAVFEKKNPVADIVLGLDRSLFSKAKEAKILLPYRPANADEIPAELLFDEEFSLAPYDYNIFAFLWNKNSREAQEGLTPPHSLRDLAKSEYEKKIILANLRTSSVGTGFGAWTVAAFGDETENFWHAILPNVLTFAPSWSAAFGLFLSGEAPLVCSYATDTAYQAENPESSDFSVLEFAEGHIFQVEGAGILQNAPNAEGARLFMDFLTSQECQALLPQTQWMFPANKNAALPTSFSAALKPAKMISHNGENLAENLDEIRKLIEK